VTVDDVPHERDLESDGWIEPYLAVHLERIRAHVKHDGGPPRGASSMERQNFNSPLWLPVLTEEVGEVANALIEGQLLAEDGLAALVDVKHLREELVQVAAMACAWIAACDREIADHYRTDYVAPTEETGVRGIATRSWHGDRTIVTGPEL
jgi:NTP pyrophosphatase (non-canonical NTP hydrolase)